MFKGFFLQIRFLTRIPLPVNPEFDEDLFARSMVLSPLVGLIIGLVSALVFLPFLNTDLFYTGIVLVIVVEIIVTGGLHFDGLADTCDGLFSNRTGKEILEIMKDPRLGTNGALGLVLLIILKIALMISLKGDNIIFTIIMMPAVSRMNILWSAGTSSYARKSGMGKSTIDHTGYREIAAAVLITAAPGYLLLGMNALPAISFPALFAVLFTRYASGKIGGITGDILGAVIELSEVVFLASMLFSQRIFGFY